MRIESNSNVFLILAIILIFFILASCLIGAYQISLNDLIFGKITTGQELILYSIRLPRILLATIVGCALATSGASMQALFRNPLADPSLIGIASGASLFVAIAIVIFPNILHTNFNLYVLNIFAFCGGILTAILIFYFAKLNGSFSITYMLLAGIAFNALAGAGTGFLSYISSDEQLRSLVFWTMGNVGGAIWSEIIITLTIIIPSLVILIKNANKLNLLILGDSNAGYIGVDVNKLKKTIIICSTLLVASAVCVSGIIGFVGLVVPHLVRLLFGSNHKLLLPISAFIGAILLLIADTIARIIVIPAEMPVGILTSLIGAPFFLFMLLKQHSSRFKL